MPLPTNRKAGTRHQKANCPISIKVIAVNRDAPAVIYSLIRPQDDNVAVADEAVRTGSPASLFQRFKKKKLQEQVVEQRARKVRATTDPAHLDVGKDTPVPAIQLALIESLLELSTKSSSRTLKAAKRELKAYAFALRALLRANSGLH